VTDNHVNVVFTLYQACSLPSEYNMLNLDYLYESKQTDTTELFNVLSKRLGKMRVLYLYFGLHEL